MKVDIEAAIEYFKDVYYETLSPKRFNIKGQAIIYGDLIVEKSCKYPIELYAGLVINKFDDKDVDWILDSTFHGNITLSHSKFDNVRMFDKSLTHTSQQRINVNSSEVKDISGNKFIDRFKIDQSIIDNLDIGGLRSLAVTNCTIKNLFDTVNKNVINVNLLSTTIENFKFGKSSVGNFNSHDSNWMSNRAPFIDSFTIQNNKKLIDFSFLPESYKFCDVHFCENIITFDGLLESHRNRRISLTGTQPRKKMLLPFSLGMLLNEYEVNGINISSIQNPMIKNGSSIYDYATALLELDFNDEAVCV